MRVIVHPSRSYSTSLPAFLSSIWQYRDLILQLTKRDVLSRYRGSILGLTWSFFHPVLMLAVYTFVFSVVFKVRWGVGSGESQADFAIILFVGLIIHGFMAECLNRAPTLILSNSNYVKKVVFPLEILPCVAAGSALFHFAISVLVLLAAQIAVQHTLAWTAIFLPLLIAPLLIGTIGLTYFISSVGVYIRDIGPTIGIVTTVLMFLAPVFFPLTALPENYRPLFFINPLTFVIENVRQILIWGQQPDWGGLLIYTLGSFIVAWIGFCWFQKTRRGFADVV